MQDFMQFGFSEEASELVNDFLDFGGTCMRPTGELYGISGGKCRKGSESEPAKKRSNLHMRAYIRLMKKAKERGKPADTSGYHSHHAFPSSIFTNKETADKHQVWLTHGEHFAAHHLVYQALKNRYGEKDQRTIKMGHAIARMATGKDNKKLSAKQYAAAMKVKGEVMKEQWKQPERVEAAAERMKKRYEDPEERKKTGELVKEKRWGDEEEKRREQAEVMKKAWKDRSKMVDAQREGWKDQERREKATARLKKRYEDEEERKKQGERMKEIANRPENKAKVSEQMKKRYENPAEREAQSKKIKAAYQNPEVKEKARQHAIGRNWYNKNGKNMFVKEHPGEGWTPGKYQTPEQKETRAQKLKETAERKRKEKEQG